jgi:hypothetical protein
LNSTSMHNRRILRHHARHSDKGRVGAEKYTGKGRQPEIDAGGPQLQPRNKFLGNQSFLRFLQKGW